MNGWHSLILVATTVLLASCVEPRFATVTIHEDSNSLVRLQFLTHSSLRDSFSHPATLSDITFRKVLSGVYIEKEVSLFSTERMRAFSDNEVEFLAPLLANGLSQATSEEIVTFLRVHEVSPEKHTITSGGAFSIGDTLYIVVGNHRAPLSSGSNALGPYRERPLESPDPEWTWDAQLDFQPAEYMVKRDQRRFEGFLEDDTPYVGISIPELTQ